MRHGVKCTGLEGVKYKSDEKTINKFDDEWLKRQINKENLTNSLKVINILREIEKECSSIKITQSKYHYIPIDWQLDFKSGYRWSESKWFKDIKISNLKGIDLKVPWELSRMQHLTQIAIAYIIANQTPEEGNVAKVYLCEFQNQILDFIATNPPEYGVNWKCTMEVGLRAVNWLFAYNFFVEEKAVFNPKFLKIFQNSLYAHGKYILENLEWSAKDRGNHYLSNITSLLFIAAFLSRNSETDTWLAFAVQELIAEVEFQFNEDGSHFEGSSCYHAFVTEMVIYGTALILGLDKEKRLALLGYDNKLKKGKPILKMCPIPFYQTSKCKSKTPFPESYLIKLEKMIEFIQDNTKPNGNLSQIGDNDSGRFVKIFPVFNRMVIPEAIEKFYNLTEYAATSENADFWQEDYPNYSDVSIAGCALFNRNDWHNSANANQIIYATIQALSKNHKIESYKNKQIQAIEIGNQENWKTFYHRFLQLYESQKRIIEIKVGGENLQTDINLREYPDFGLFIYRSKRLFLSVRCGQIGRGDTGVHAHNDQLSIELNVDKTDVIVDPGTYLYTPFPSLRNKYRASNAHFVPCIKGREQGSLKLGLFRLGNEAKAKKIYAGIDGFWGQYNQAGTVIFRGIHILKDKIIIYDGLDSPPKRAYQLIPIESLQDIKFSEGYGIVANYKYRFQKTVFPYEINQTKVN